MAVLITGGAGFIGSHLALELSKHNIVAVVIDNLSTGYRELVPSNFVFVNGDLADNILLEDLFIRFQFESIFHFSAKTVVPESFQNPMMYYYENFINSLSLIRLALKHKVKYFIFSNISKHKFLLLNFFKEEIKKFMHKSISKNWD